MHLILRLLTVVSGALAIAGPARALCDIATTTPLTFAASSSYDVRAGTVASTSSPAGFACNGTVITVIGSNYARATVTSANGFRVIGPGGDAVPYTLSADPGGTWVFTQGRTIDYFDPALLSLLTILNGSAFGPRLYAALPAGANVAAGTYSDTLTIQWAWNVCHGVNLANICVLGETGTGTASVTASIVIGKDCRISAPAIAFGSKPLVGQFDPVAQAVAVDCTKNATYTVAFTSGTAGSARPWRTMGDGVNHTLQYNIYRADGTTIWDETNPMPGTAAGTGALVPGQLQSYRARINPAQTTPPAGHYTDMVSVVVTF